MDIMNYQRERLKKIAKVLDRIQVPDFDPYIANLYQRKLVQKKIFLLQELGLQFNYLFKWHAFGPYSEELAEDIREVLLRKKKGFQFKTEDRVISGEESIVDKLSYFEMEKIEDSEDLATFYEIASSIQFLSSRFPDRFKDSEDKENAIINNLITIKPDLQEQIKTYKANVLFALKACNLLA